MGLINIPDINTDDAATAELWNSKFATIVDVINGNLDDDNLADGAVTTPKLADGAVTSVKIADNTIDAAKMENPVAFRAHRTTNQAISGGTWTKLQANTEVYDYGANYDNATNYRFTPPVDGVYHFSGSANFSSSERILVQFSVNGGDNSMYRGTDFELSTASAARSGAAAHDIELTTSDYVEFHVWSDDAVNVTGAWSGHLVGQVQ